MATLGFPVIDTGNPYTVLDAYNAALYNNGARAPLGTLARVPLPVGTVGSPAKGLGSSLAIKYVRYLSTANPAVVGGPAVVYWTDLSFTTVTGVSTEGLGVNFAAGWLLPNTVSISGFTAAQLNGNFVWIGLSGYIPGCVSVGSTAVGDSLIGAAGNFTVARVAAGTAPTNQSLGWAATAVSSGLSDVVATLPVF